MGILSGLQTYAQKFTETDRFKFAPEDANAVDEAVVVNSKYGLSACFHMKAGGTKYIPLSESARMKSGEGEVLDLDAVDVIQLSRPGDDDIYRIDF